jgi:hypothetical protein
MENDTDYGHEETYTWTNHSGYETDGEDEDVFELTIIETPFQVTLKTTSFKYELLFDGCDDLYGYFGERNEVGEKDPMIWSSHCKIDDIINFLISNCSSMGKGDERDEAISHLEKIKENLI